MEQIKKDSSAQAEGLRTEIVTLKEKLNHMDAYVRLSVFLYSSRFYACCSQLQTVVNTS